MYVCVFVYMFKCNQTAIVAVKEKWKMSALLKIT